MKERALAQPVKEFAFARHKIAFVSGPRQCGKTTLSRMLIRERKTGVYHNWDDLEFRRAWATRPSSIVPRVEGGDVPLVVLDEIHKERRWKRNLKGIYDTRETPCDFLVTGSARLNVYMRGSDSLLGRHVSFRLHPFSIREMERPDVSSPDEAMDLLFARARPAGGHIEERLSLLTAYGPFPEPLLRQSAREARIWRRGHERLVIREDLRDLSRLPELARIEMMTTLLPERVGALFSMASMGRDLEVSIPTVKRWLGYLKALYYLFEVKPYHRSIPRSLRREGKVYLWDYAAVPAAATRFENLVAAHLLKACDYWTDTGEGEFELFFLRDREKREIDFLIVRDGTPWLPVEVKQADTEPSPNWKRFAGVLPCKRGLQLVAQPAWKLHTFGETQILVAGAAEALQYLI
jgi:predicted AAA+ superfamily ATPase